MPLRFTIRDLLWLTLVAALAVGWWIDHRRTDSAMREAQTKAAILQAEFVTARSKFEMAFEQLRARLNWAEKITSTPLLGHP